MGRSPYRSAVVRSASRAARGEGRQLGHRRPSEDHRRGVDDVLRGEAVMEVGRGRLVETRPHSIEEREHRRPCRPALGEDVGAHGCETRLDDRFGSRAEGCLPLRLGTRRLPTRRRALPRPASRRSRSCPSSRSRSRGRCSSSDVEEHGLVVALVADVEPIRRDRAVAIVDPLGDQGAAAIGGHRREHRVGRVRARPRRRSTRGCRSGRACRGPE